MNKLSRLSPAEMEVAGSRSGRYRDPVSEMEYDDYDSLCDFLDAAAGQEKYAATQNKDGEWQNPLPQKWCTLLNGWRDIEDWDEETTLSGHFGTCPYVESRPVESPLTLEVMLMSALSAEVVAKHLKDLMKRAGWDVRKVSTTVGQVGQDLTKKDCVDRGRAFNIAIQRQAAIQHNQELTRKFLRTQQTTKESSNG